MRIGFLGSPNSWYLRDLQRVARDQHQIRPLSFQRLASSLSHSSAGFSDGEAELANCDVVLVRSMPPGSLEQVVFRMDVLGCWQAAGGLLVNPARSLEIAIDKYLSIAKLQRAGFRVPETIVCQTPEDAIAAFERLGGDVVVKPIFGGEGRGITRVTDEAVATRSFKMLTQCGAVLYLQRYLPHDGCDMRLLVIGDDVLGMMRCNTNDWRSNVSLGATTKTLEVDQDLRETALRAARVVGAWIAAVDILPAADGNRYVLEVNAVPGWRALAATLNVDVARLVLNWLENATCSDEVTASRETHLLERP